MIESYFADATYYQKSDPLETSSKDKEGGTKPRKLKVKHGAATTKGYSSLLPKLVTQDLVLPLAHLSGMCVNPYQTSSIFLPESHTQPPNSSRPSSERELKDLVGLLLHTKLAAQLLQNSGFD